MYELTHTSVFWIGWLEMNETWSEKQFSNSCTVISDQLCPMYEYGNWHEYESMEPGPSIFPSTCAFFVD